MTYTVSNLVTVTCDMDREQMLIQAESLKHLTEPVTHYVIVNEASKDGYLELLEPYYTVHTLKLIARPFECFNNDGWLSQQAFKLWIYQTIQDSYVVLDSKNFFIQACSLSDWAELNGCGFLENYTAKPNWLATIDHYSALFDVPVTYQHMSMQTPFLFDDVVMRTIDFSTLMVDFCSVDPMPSEFLLYSVLAQKVGYKGRLARKHMTLFPLHRGMDINLADLSYPVVGLHRDYLTTVDISNVNAYLRSQGLQHQLSSDKA